MKILGVSGSPKKGGFTDSLLESALKGASDAGGSVEKLVANDLDIRGCQECGDSLETGECTTADDMQPVYKKFDEMDAVIVASPIYFGSMSGQLKVMIDRFQKAWAAKYILKRKPPYQKRRRGIFLCVAGQERREYFENAKQIIKIFFTTLDIDYKDELFFGGYNVKEHDDKEKAAALERAYALGRSLAGDRGDR